jgi:hypothetical protein
VPQVFAAAKAAAPSVIRISDAEQIFIQDKSRAAALAPPGGEPPCRLRRQLLAEAAALTPAHGVLVLCTSASPQACVQRDEADFLAFFQLLVHLPLPGERSRRALLAAFAAHEEGARWGEDEGRSAAALTVAAHLSADYAPGQLKRAVGAAAAAARAAGETAAGRGGGMVARFAEALAGLPPVSAAEQEALREWTARAHAPQQAAQAAPAGRQPAAQGANAKPRK